MLTKIDHIGIVVRDLKQTLRFYKNSFNLDPIYSEKLKDINVIVSFLRVGEVPLEFLQPLGEGAGDIGRFSETVGEGFHHIAYRVDDIEKHLENLKGLKIGLRDKEHRPGAGNSRIIFIEPAYTQGVLTEIVERIGEIGD